MNKPFHYLLFSILVITFINFFVAGAIYCIRILYPLPRLIDFILIFVGAIISAIIVILITPNTIPILKDFLNTYRRLLRLENLTHPLLVRLSTEAPGTYHHSLTTAVLSYHAAKDIGADALLTRVGGYYHDIGKLKNPGAFTENQKSPRNRDDTAKLPEQIIAHITEGLKMANQYNLPTELSDFIAQHHGTTKVSYFKGNLYYPGPKPLSKEAGILMLADVVEARSRTLGKLTPKDIGQIIDETIASRLNENQLILSGLTSQDLAKIRLSFIVSLKNIFHDRIKYPKEKSKGKTQNSKQ